MDKAQDSLIKTYFRKRSIAQKQSERYKYEDFEMTYMLENNINLSTFSNVAITFILIKQPQYVNRFDLSKLDGNEITHLLKYQPKLIDAEGLNGSKLNLSELDGDDITKLIITYHHQELIDRFDLSKLNPYLIVIMLMFHPDWINKFDLNKFDGAAISYLLQRKPEFIDRFNLNLLDDYDIKDLMLHQPQLAKYFNR